MYNLNQFSNNGVSWPFNINDLAGKNLESEYFDFQSKALSIMKKYHFKTKFIIKIF